MIIRIVSLFSVGGQHLCPDGSYPVLCFVNPCDVESCPAYPSARCRPNYCTGGCVAEFFDEEDNQIECGCPRGKQLLRGSTHLSGYSFFASNFTS